MEKPRRFTFIVGRLFILGVSMNKQKEINSLKVEIKECNSIQNDPDYIGEITAYFSTYGHLNFKNDIMIQGCFDEMIQAFNSGAEKMPRYLDQHRDGQYNGHTRRVIGVVTKVFSDQYGAGFTAKYINTSAGRDAYIEVKTKAVEEFSFGWYCAECNYNENGNREVLKVEGFDEISQVLWGADNRTKPIEINSELTIRDAEKILRNGGFNKYQAKTILSKGFNALDRDDSGASRDDEKELNQAWNEGFTSIFKSLEGANT